MLLFRHGFVKFSWILKWSLVYSDFHSLMRFISIKIANNILYNVCLKVFYLVKLFVAKLHSTDPKNTYICTQWTQKKLFIFCIWISKIRRILSWFQIHCNNWKRVHSEKLFSKHFCMLVVKKSTNSNFVHLFCIYIFC